MFLFATSLFISLGAVVFAVYYFNQEVDSKLSREKVELLFNVIRNTANVHLRFTYLAIVVVSIVFSLIFLSIKSLGLSAVAGFLFGVLSLILAVYFSFLFLLKINKRIIYNNTNSIVKTFHHAFDGGDYLSMFIMGSVLLNISLYYIIFKPTAIGLVSMVFGVIVAGLFVKIASNFLVIFLNKDTLFFSKLLFGDNSKENTNTRNSLASIVSLTFKNGISVFSESLEISIIAIVGSMIAASFIFPGFGGAIALPLIIIAMGIISSFIGSRLIKIGSTTNIIINILLVILSTIILAALLIFPFIIWAMHGNGQYSNIALWASVFFGFLTGGALIVLNYFNTIKKIGYRESLAFLSAFIALSVAISTLFAGLYGMTLFLVGMISLYGVFLKLNIFSLAINTAHASGSIVNFESKYKEILEKLNSISKLIFNSVRIYLYMVTIFSALVFFFIYKHEILPKVTQFSFQLDNPLVMAGLFLGGGILYVVISRASAVEGNAYKILKNNKNLSKTKENILEEDDYAHRVKIFINSIIKSSFSFLSILFITPILVAFIFGPEVLGGLLVGEVIIGTFLGMYILLENNLKKDNRYQNTGENDNVKPIIFIISSILKITMSLSLLLVALFI